MTDQQKIDYMRIGLSLVGFACDDSGAEMIIRVYEGIQEKEGKFSVEDAVRIKHEIRNRHDGEFSTRMTADKLLEKITQHIDKLAADLTTKKVNI